MRIGTRSLGVLVLLAFAVGGAEAGTIHGTVKNGTTGKPAAGIEVILIQLQGGMQPVANSKTDGEGQFSFENASLGTQPMLVRAVYHGVNFHQPAPPGKSEIQIEVFEPTADTKTINVPSHIVIVQPNGSSLLVGEEYSIQNSGTPPKAYFRADGNFEFAIPDKAQLQQTAAWGPAGMPVVQAAIDKTKNHYAIAFAFRPGESGMRYSYELPYGGNAATLKLPTIYPTAKLLVLAPPSVQVTGEGLEAGGQEQGMTVYGRGAIPANTLYTLNISGTAPRASAGNAETGGQDAQGASGPAISVIPGRLDVLKWPLIGGFIGLFALGAILLARKPVMAVAAVGASPETATQAAQGIARQRSSPTATAVTVAGNGKTANLADLDAAVGLSLDSLKDQIFRLELRRQAGTISEEEYSQERARTEKVLRDLVRG